MPLRYAEGHADRLPALAADLVGRKVDLIVAAGSASWAKTATSTIPILFAVGIDPVAEGLVASLARPGGYLTGVARFNVELIPKRLELLSELVPQAKVIGLLVDPSIPISAPVIREVQKAARAMGLQLAVLEAGTESEIETAFAVLAKRQVGGLLVAPAALFFAQRQQLLALASRHAVPAIYDNREYVVAGGLITYDNPWATVYRQIGIYAGKILNGAKPADLPVVQPTKFELVINLKTAQALGLTVPQSLLARADEVIE